MPGGEGGDEGGGGDTGGAGGGEAGDGSVGGKGGSACRSTDGTNPATHWR